MYVPDVAWAEEGPAVPEWAVDDGEAQDGLSAQATLPTAYDMRSDGLVTPVKFQNPWGSCWAFGGTAAAETSIISAYGSTYEQSQLDLSERHLTYFALQPVSEAVDPNQVGEGLHTINPSANAAFDAGGLPVYITTLFSQGIGPMIESLYPYRGNGARRSIDDFNENPEAETMETLAPQFGGMEGLNAFIEGQMSRTGRTREEVIAGLVAFVKDSYESSPTYSKNDDWSIPETNEDGTPNRLVSNGMVLRDGNVLPPYWVGDETSPNQAGVEAIKQEVLNGRGVSIMYHADQSTLYARNPDAENPNQTQYVFDKVGLDHGVCIVGWDDNFNKDNFHHEAKVPQADGPTIDRTEETTPPDNGAWIVKNSWGSETDATTDDLGNVINSRKWGTLNDEGKSTGYFYLSYYDKSITQAESMEFDADLGSGGSFAVLQHDYMPSDSGFYTTPATDAVTSSANVFEAKDSAIALKGVSTRTSETNARVTLAIYELNDGATDPTNGKLLYRTSRNFEYGGFHRLNIDLPITIGKGKKFSVVSTMSTVGPGGAREYRAVASQGATEAYVRAARGDKAKAYSSAVVNEGESYLYKDGSWVDWRTYTNELPANDEIKKYLPNAEKYIDAAPIDNFSIKAYGVPVEEPEPEPEPQPSALDVNYTAHCQNLGWNAPAGKNGSTAGTTGQALRLEALTAKVEGASVAYRSHVEDVGWEDEWARDGGESGSTGQGRRVEAIQMQLEGDATATHDVWYRVHSEDFGWLGWTHAGEPAGTAGMAKRVEAYQVVVLPKGEVPSGHDPALAAYRTRVTGQAHVQDVGWQPAAQADFFGTTGMSRRVEALRLRLDGQPWGGGIAYAAHVQDIGWQDETADGGLAGTTGQAKRLEAVRIRLTGELADHLSVWYRVHSQNVGWLGWAHDGEEAEEAGTSGLSLRAESVEVVVLPKDAAAPGPTENHIQTS